MNLIDVRNQSLRCESVNSRGYSEYGINTTMINTEEKSEYHKQTIETLQNHKKLCQLLYDNPKIQTLSMASQRLHFNRSKTRLAIVSATINKPFLWCDNGYVGLMDDGPLDFTEIDRLIEERNEKP
jgi:hypothetical protein